MLVVNSIKTWAKSVIELDIKAILLSGEVITYKLSKEEIDKEFNKYNSKINKNKF